MSNAMSRLQARLDAIGPTVSCNSDRVIEFLPNTSLEVQAALQAEIDSFDFDLENLRDQKIKELDDAYEALLARGYEVPGKGFFMRASPDSQAEYMKLDSAINRFVAAGLWNDTTEFPIADASGVSRVLTVGEWPTIALGYTGFCMTAWSNLLAGRAAIELSPTVDELNSITTP
jgi:hypothetical protein